MSVHIVCPFLIVLFFLLSSFENSFYILIFLDMWYIYIFFPICSLFFHPFNRAKIFPFDEVHFINFSLNGSYIWFQVWKLFSPRSWRFPPIVLKSFMVFLHLSSCFYLCLPQSLQHYFFKNLPFLFWIALAPLSKISWTCFGVFLESVPLICVSLPLPIPSKP